MDLTSAGALRRGLSTVAIAATLPYLTLKLLWLSGSHVGVIDPALMDSSSLWALNLITFGMDAVAIAVALGLVSRWGRRIPAGLLAFPLWVATGLIGTLMLALLVYLPASAVAGGEHAQRLSDFLRPWVYAMVYGGFCVQGLCLFTGFLLYARERWAGLLRSRIADLPRTATLTLQRTLTCVATLLVVPVVGADLYWACGGMRGLAAAAADEPQLGFRATTAVLAALAVLACATMLSLVFRYRGRRALRPRFLLAWFATASLFNWGAWLLVAGTLSLHVPDQRHAVPPLDHLIAALQTISGLLLLVTGSVALVERADLESGR